MEEKKREKAIITGLCTGDEKKFEYSMYELKELAKACDLEVVGEAVQRAEAVTKAFYIGSGKVEEIGEMARALKADIVIFDNQLSPMQLRNLHDAIELPIMDRTTLILEIFSRRAGTRESKLQVQTAALKYALPRLAGLHDSLSRQGGASGALSNKGSGEKQIELDRRHIEARLAALRSELERLATGRRVQRARRKKNPMPIVGLVGYTNAGKSSIMNGMTDLIGAPDDKHVFEENMLFATLETSVRRMEIADGKSFLLSDTVGFIDELPHGLIEAFKSTLEEICDADLLLHVIDCADERFRERIEVTNRTLAELGAGDIPVLYIYNKADKRENCMYPTAGPAGIYICAKERESIEFLTKQICDRLFGDRRLCELLIPYDKGSVLNLLNSEAQVIDTKYEESGTRVKAYLGEVVRGRCAEYIVGEEV